MYDRDILDVVKTDITTGAVSELNDVTPYINAIERGFPIGLNRIAWDKHRGSQRAEVFPVGAGPLHARDVERRLEDLRDIVSSWLAEEGVEYNAEAVWVGDMTEIGLRMSVEKLLEYFPRLFALPQHAYAVSQEGDWCLNYVMEGELFFGKSSS